MMQEYVLRKLASLGTRKIFPKGLCVAKPGDVYDHCYLIQKGSVFSFEYAHNGAERAFGVLMPGDVFLLPFVLAKKPATLYFQTTEVTDTVCISRDDLLRAMLTDEELMVGITSLLACGYNDLLNQLCEKSTHCATWKLCDLFLSFAEQHGKPYDHKVMIAHKVSQDMMGRLLGVSRVTVTRILSEIKALRLIEYVNGYYCIRDIETLQSFRDSSDLAYGKAM